MSRKLSRVLALCGSLIPLGTGNVASAQLFGGGCCPTSCGAPPPSYSMCAPPPMCAPMPPPICAAPVAYSAPQQQVVQVQQPVYQQVAETYFEEEKQTVQVPRTVTETQEVPYTAYRTEYETRTAQVPQVQYQTVTEMQTVQRDMGRWVTQYQCRPQLTPCQYDNRPNMLGALNRASYQMRMSFTPKYTVSRCYQPNVVTQQIPTQRQVAQYTTKAVTYQVSKLVPYQTTQKVTTNRIVFDTQERTVKVPKMRTRTVQTGTTTQYAVVPTGTTTTALAAPSTTALSYLPATTYYGGSSYAYFGGYGYPYYGGGAYAMAPIITGPTATAWHPAQSGDPFGAKTAEKLDPTPVSPRSADNSQPKIDEGLDDIRNRKTSIDVVPPRTFEANDLVPRERLAPENSIVSSEKLVAGRSSTGTSGVSRWTARRPIVGASSRENSSKSLAPSSRETNSSEPVTVAGFKSRTRQ